MDIADITKILRPVLEQSAARKRSNQQWETTLNRREATESAARLDALRDLGEITPDEYDQGMKWVKSLGKEYNNSPLYKAGRAITGKETIRGPSERPDFIDDIPYGTVKAAQAPPPEPDKKKVSTGKGPKPRAGTAAAYTAEENKGWYENIASRLSAGSLQLEDLSTRQKERYWDLDYKYKTDSAPPAGEIDTIDDPEELEPSRAMSVGGDTSNVNRNSLRAGQDKTALMQKYPNYQNEIQKAYEYLTKKGVPIEEHAREVEAMIREKLGG